MQIGESCFNGGVTKQFLDRVDIRTLFEQVGGKTVPQCMNAPAFGYAGFFFAA